ncbi:complement factor H-like [Podarcis muralis]
MKNRLFCIVSFLLWTCCTFQHVCTPDIDFGVIIENKRAQYLERDRLQYKCFPGYELEGSGWITCKEDGWTPRPKCFAPCTITKQQLEARNLLLYGGQKHSELIKNARTMEFICVKGYIIISPSVRTCIDGNMDLPSCNPVVSDQETSVTGDIPTLTVLPKIPFSVSPQVMCTAPEIGGGNFFPVKSQYKFEEVISAKCNQGYQLESRKSSFKCTKYGWLPSPKCVPKQCDYPHIENGALSWSNTYYSDVYFPKKEGQTISFRCKHGFLPENKKYWYRIRCTSLGWDPEPKCFRLCTPPKHLPHGEVIYDSKNNFIEGDNVSFRCDAGYRPENQATATCTKNDWSPTPSCSSLCKLYLITDQYTSDCGYSLSDSALNKPH